MKEWYFFLCFIFLLSCENEKVEYEDIFLHFNYSIHLDDSNRITKYIKMFENGKVIEIVEYTFKEKNLIVETYYPNYLLAQKTLYKLASNGYAISSIDSIYGKHFRTVIKNYTYEDGYLTETMGTIFYHEDAFVNDSLRFYEACDIENGGLNQVSKSSEPNLPCIDYYDNLNIVPVIDVMTFNNGVLGLSHKLPRSISLRNGCPCGPSSELGKIKYEYTFDESDRIEKIKETVTYCHNKYVTPIKRQITITEYTYRHFTN